MIMSFGISYEHGGDQEEKHGSGRAFGAHINLGGVIGSSSSSVHLIYSRIGVVLTRSGHMYWLKIVIMESPVEKMLELVLPEN